MSDTATIEAPATDRVKLPFTYDVDKLIAEAEALNLSEFNPYDVLPLRAPAHIIDPSLPMPPATEDHADGSWTEWANAGALTRAPYIQSIIEEFQ